MLTQPDRPAGRGKQVDGQPGQGSCARARPESLAAQVTLRDEDAVAGADAALEPDIMIVAAYGLILPQQVLDIPRAGCLNVHASMLPSWRGAAPIQAAILAGDETTGVCLMAMEAGLDTGPVLCLRGITIGTDATRLVNCTTALRWQAGASCSVKQRSPPILSPGTLAREPQDDARWPPMRRKSKLPMRNSIGSNPRRQSSWRNGSRLQPGTGRLVHAR